MFYVCDTKDACKSLRQFKNTLGFTQQCVLMSKITDLLMFHMKVNISFALRLQILNI